MIPLAEKELDRLVAESIIVLVQFADWAMPIVTVLKQQMCQLGSVVIFNSLLLRRLNWTATQIQN